MANHISDETIEYVGILAKLELNEEEKEQAKKDMESMLDYIDKLNELDTEGVEPLSHVFLCNGTLTRFCLKRQKGFYPPKILWMSRITKWRR